MNDHKNRTREYLRPPLEFQPIIDAAVAHALGEGP